MNRIQLIFLENLDDNTIATTTTISATVTTVVTSTITTTMAMSTTKTTVIMSTFSNNESKSFCQLNQSDWFYIVIFRL